MSDRPDTTNNTTDTTQTVRSPVLNYIRLNPFRVLDVPNDITAEEAVWKSEELLTLNRAGLPRHGELALPWLTDADDFELHQAVQTIEEPLRRIVSQLFWFDRENDIAAANLNSVLSSAAFAPPTKLLRRDPHKMISLAALPTLPPAPAANDALAAEPEKPGFIPKINKPEKSSSGGSFSVQSCPACGVRVVPNKDGTCPSCRVRLEEPAEEETVDPTATTEYSTAEAPVQRQEVKEFIPKSTPPPIPQPAPFNYSEEDTIKAVSSAVNTANLALLHAAATLHGFCQSTNDTYSMATDVTLEWKHVNQCTVASDPHNLVPEVRGNIGQLTVYGRQWAHAIEAWNKLLGSRAFQEYVKVLIRNLDDDLVTEDDVETIVTAVRVQITDFLVGEIKLLIIDGRYDMVEALLSSVSAGDMDSREWRIAFRPLRQLFDSEIKDLSNLVTEREHLRSQDLTVFTNRLESLREQWETLDRDGILGLRQLIDEQVRWMFNRLREVVDISTLDEITPLFKRCKDMAFANSLTQEIESYLQNISDRESWECYFCRKNEMDFDSGVTLFGQKETHRETVPGGTRIHYAVRRCWVPRCNKCARLHDFFFSTSFGMWLCLMPALVYILYYFWNTYDGWDWLIRAGSAVLIYWLTGFLTRIIVSMKLTPGGERRYYAARKSKIYLELSIEGYGITVNYKSDAVPTMQAQA